MTVETLAAINLVSSIMQCGDISTKLVVGAKAIHVSTHGIIRKTQTLKESILLVRSLSIRLSVSATALGTDEERAMNCLAQECRSISEQILCLIDTPLPSNPRHRAGSLFALVRRLKRFPEVRELDGKLVNYRRQLQSRIRVLSRYGIREGRFGDHRH